MGILERIKDIEAEMARTQRNKATMSHLCRLKAQLAKLRAQVMEGPAGSSSAGPGDGFEVSKTGSARIALIGFPSVGKSTLLSALTGTESLACAYEFTTLTCVPGNIQYMGTKIQLLDLPGIIQGAAHGAGRGRQVIACTKSCDMILMILDAAKEQEKNHRAILERELELAGLRLNKRPPNIAFSKKKTGGVKFNVSGCKLTQFGEDPEKTVRSILQEYKIHNCEVLIREDCSPEDFIDLIQGNVKYIKCLYAYNKVDMVTVEEMDALARKPHSTVISCNMQLNLDGLLSDVWRCLDLTRIYTRKRGQPPDFSEPVVLTKGRHGITVESSCLQIHRGMIDNFNYANVWGQSCKFSPQRCGLSHILKDEDVVEIVTKTNVQQRRMRDYSKKVQQHYDAIKAKRKAKGKLKT